MATLYHWKKGIINLPTLELRPDTGGYITAKWGSLSVIPDMFNGPPKQKLNVALAYGQAYYVSIPLFSGTVLLKSYTKKSLEYEIYQPEITIKMLPDGVDENSETIQIPLAVGTVTHMKLQRTGTVGIYKYYQPDFAGSLGTDWHIYDDGVQIDDHWTDNGDGTMTRSVAIIGVATASGTGNKTDLEDVFTYGATRLGVDLVSPHDADINIDHVFYEDEFITDVLGGVAWYAGYQWYFGEDPETEDVTLVLYDVEDQNGESNITGFDYVYLTYSWPDRIKTLSAEVTTYTYDEEHVETLKLDGDYPMAGQEQTLEFVYSEDSTRVATQLDWHLAYLQKPWVEVQLPFLRMPQHGEKVTFSDYRKQSVKVEDGVFRIEEISLNPKGRLMTLSGRADITFEDA